VAPFAGAAALALAALPLPPHGSRALELIGAGVTAVLIVVALFFPWERLPAGAQSLPPLAYFGVIALLREAEGGGTSGYAPLLLVPIFWLALHGTRREMWLGLVLTAAMLTIPIVTLGEPHYPVTEWRRALVWIAVAPLVGLTTQRLVMDARRRSAESALEARTDALTGLPNRRVWDELLEREIARSRRSGQTVSVAMLDLDHFKLFNDSKGHQAGDLLLKEAAAAWKAKTRETDLLARYGGEEFTILLPGAELEQARQIVERIRAATPAGETCSAGIATWDGSESAQALLERADEALYLAKESGRDRSAVAVVV
jgi:diguanylate cyclase (GGDEF)-like protein